MCRGAGTEAPVIPPTGATDLRDFFRRLPVATILAVVAWIVLRGVLDSTTCAMAQVITRAYEHPRVTRLVVADHRAELRRADFRADSAIPTVALSEIHFNTAVLLALFLSLRRPLSKVRLKRLVVGWSILFLVQVFNLIIHLKFTYASALGPWSLQHYSDLSRNLYGFLQMFTDLPVRFALPFVIWIGFNWDEIMEMFSGGVSGS